MKSPIVGMGIGQLYFKIPQMKWVPEVITVDTKDPIIIKT